MGEALPKRFRAMVDVGAGLGMHQGEILAFSPDDVNWLLEGVKIQRQSRC
jgi:hypothetical protein